MLRERCEEFVRELEKSEDNGLTTLKVRLEANGWYDSKDENTDLSEALYKYLKLGLIQIFSQDLELSQSYVDELFDE